MTFMPLIELRDGYYDENGTWHRTKCCFVYCGDRCTCMPPNGIWQIRKDNELSKIDTDQKQINTGEAKMYKWVIDKEFHFEMGHRVWAQKLDHAHLSISTECACKHLHGHSYMIKVFLGADELDQSQMVTDFKNLNFMKEFVDNVLDHKFMIDINDPNFSLITGCKAIPAEIEDFTNLGNIIPSDTPGEQLHRKSFVLVNFVPTSENICRYLKEFAQKFIGDIAKVVAVELWETKKSHCRYGD